MISNFDKLFGTETANSNAKQKGGEKSKTELLQKARNECYAMIEEACTDATSTAAKLIMLLDVESRFSFYSLNNNLLIYAQKPYAVRFKSFDGWKTEGGSVKAGAKAFMILEPHEYTGKNGEKRIAYKPKKVFDISDVVFQNKEQAQEISMRYDARALLTALLNNVPVPVKKAESAKMPVNTLESAYYDNTDHCVYFRQNGKGLADAFPAIAMALAHAEMAKTHGENHRADICSFQARCAAYVLSQKYGIPTDTIRIDSIPPRYTDMSTDEIKSELSEIHFIVKSIDARMRDFFLDMEYEKNRIVRKHDGGAR